MGGGVFAMRGLKSGLALFHLLLDAIKARDKIGHLNLILSLRFFSEAAAIISL